MAEPLTDTAAIVVVVVVVVIPVAIALVENHPVAIGRGTYLTYTVSACAQTLPLLPHAIHTRGEISGSACVRHRHCPLPLPTSNIYEYCFSIYTCHA